MFCERCTSMLQAVSIVEELLRNITLTELLRTSEGCYICYACACTITQSSMREITEASPPFTDSIVLRWNFRLYRKKPRLTIKVQSPVHLHMANHSWTIFEFFMPSSGTQRPRALVYQPPADSSSPVAHMLIAKWLQRCTTDHVNCRRSRASSYVPPRLIDTMSQPPRLIISEAESETIAEYATLSHCWGVKPQFLTLTADNIERFQFALPMQDIAKTFVDAIVLCRNIGFRYLWIDSLTILQQGHGSQEDWTRHVAEMPDIYQHALFNIAAEWGASSESGLFSWRNTALIEKAVVTLGKGPTQGTYNVQCSSTEGLSHYLRSAPLQKRGWVMQERLLSPRIVHFTKHQICWECSQSEDVCERWPDGNDFSQKSLDDEQSTKSQSMFIDKVKRAFGNRSQVKAKKSELSQLERARNTWTLVQRYADHVRAYSLLQLTYPDVDKLPAFGAIAKQFSSDFQADYIAGLFDCHLPSALAWQVDICTRHTNVVSMTYRCPSWSWASVDGLVTQSSGMYYHQRVLNTLAGKYRSVYLPLARKERLDVTLKDPENTFGRIINATITLRAPLIPCHWQVSLNTERKEDSQGQMYVDIPTLVIEEDMYSIKFDRKEDLEGSQQHVVIALIDAVFMSPNEGGGYGETHVWALILRAFDGHGNTRRYRRIGGGSLQSICDARKELEALPTEAFVVV